MLAKLENESRRRDKARQKRRCGIENRPADQVALDHPVNDAFAVRPPAEDARNSAIRLQLTAQWRGYDLGRSVEKNGVIGSGRRPALRQGTGGDHNLSGPQSR